MAIRTRDDALQALREVLNLDRRSQIVVITARIGACLSPEARQILFRAQEGLVNGKLQMRLKERETMRQTRGQEPGAPPKEGQPIDDARMNEEIATALEALKVAAVVFDVFPDLRRQIARWEVARAALHFGEDMRRLITDGTDPAKAAQAQQELTTSVARFRPWWHSQVGTIQKACDEVLHRSPPTRWRIGARSLLDVVATTELRAMYAAKENIPTYQAMLEPLSKIYRVLQRIVTQVYPSGLPEESALAE